MSVLDCNMSFEDDTSINSQYQNQDNVQDAFQNGLQLYSCNTNSINNHKTPCCDITIYNNTKLPEVGMVEFFSEESLRVSISGDNSTESMLSLRHTGSYHGDNNTHLVWRISTSSSHLGSLKTLPTFGVLRIGGTEFIDISFRGGAKALSFNQGEVELFAIDDEFANRYEDETSYQGERVDVDFANALIKLPLDTEAYPLVYVQEIEMSIHRTDDDVIMEDGDGEGITTEWSAIVSDDRTEPRLDGYLSQPRRGEVHGDEGDDIPFYLASDDIINKCEDILCGWGKGIAQTIDIHNAYQMVLDANNSVDDTDDIAMKIALQLVKDDKGIIRDASLAQKHVWVCDICQKRYQHSEFKECSEHEMKCRALHRLKPFFRRLLRKRRAVKTPEPLVVNSSVQDYFESSASTYTNAAEVNGSSFSFGVLYKRDMNANQKAKFTSLKKDCKHLYEIFREEGHCVTVNSHLGECVNYRDPLLSIDNENPHTYHHHQRKKKGGCGHGKNRRQPYIEEWQKEFPGEEPTISSVTDFYNLPVDFQRMMTKKMLDTFRSYTYTPEQIPKTPAEAAKLDMNGLPIATQNWLHSMIYTSEESPYGGALPIHGNLTRFYINTNESGAQVFDEDYGYPTDRTANLHEWAHSNSFGLYVAQQKEVLENLKQCFAKLAESEPLMYNLLLKLVHKVEEICLAWMVGIMPSTPDEFENAKPMLAKIACHCQVVDNAFVGPPTENPSTWEECHDTKPFRDNDGERQWEAVRRMKNKVTRLETCGGSARVGAFDTTSLAWEIVGYTFVEYLTKHRQSLGEGMEWHIHWNYLGLTILFVKVDPVERVVRVMVVFCPLCNILFSKADVRISFFKLAQSLDTAKTAQFMYYFFGKLLEANADDNFDLDLHGPVHKDTRVYPLQFMWHWKCNTPPHNNLMNYLS